MKLRKKRKHQNTLNRMWSIPSWISLNASRARRLAATPSILASSNFCNSSSTPCNFFLGAIIAFLKLLFPLKPPLSMYSTPFQKGPVKITIHYEIKKSKKNQKIKKFIKCFGNFTWAGVRNCSSYLRWVAYGEKSSGKKIATASKKFWGSECHVE